MINCFFECSFNDGLTLGTWGDTNIVDHLPSFTETLATGATFESWPIISFDLERDPHDGESEELTGKWGGGAAVNPAETAIGCKMLLELRRSGLPNEVDSPMWGLRVSAADTVVTGHGAKAR